MRPIAEGDPDSDWFFTVEAESESEMKVKGSRFLSYVSPVKNKEDAEAFIRAISKKHRDASHVCFAYRAAYGDLPVFRYSDAGEPAGTAGRPILMTMDSRGIHFAVCVVVRFFGGIKLGTGGLSRAYAQVSAAALEKAGKIKKWNTELHEVVFPFEHTGTVRLLLSKYQCTIERILYEEDTKILVQVRKSMSEKLKHELLDATAGKVHLHAVCRISKGLEETEAWRNAPTRKQI